MARSRTCRDFYLTELQEPVAGGGGRNDSGMWADSTATTISIVICAGVPRLPLVGFHHLHGSVVGPSPAAGGCAATAASDRNNRQCAAPPSPHRIRRDSSASRVVRQPLPSLFIRQSKSAKSKRIDVVELEIFPSIFVRIR